MFTVILDEAVVGIPLPQAIPIQGIQRNIADAEDGVNASRHTYDVIEYPVADATPPERPVNGHTAQLEGRSCRVWDSL